MKFPSLKAGRILAILQREPLGYEIKRQEGSHRAMESRNGYPPIGFTGHETDTWGRTYVRKLFVKQIGLSEADAMKVIKGKKL